MTAPADPPPGRTDESLLRLVGAGDPAAADALYRRYAPRLEGLVRSHLSRRLAPRLDPADIVQSVFRRFLTAARDGRYSLPGGHELWGLLVVIAVNRLRSAEVFHRAAKRDVRQTVGLADADPPAADAAVGMAVDDALARLPEHHREVARLRLDGYEVGEIAQKLNQSKRSVERVLQDTRRRLSDFLQSEAETADHDTHPG